VSESNAKCEPPGCAGSAEDFNARIGQTHERDVHIWQVDLADSCWDVFSHILSLDEQEKADRFRTLKLRQHYRRFRSALRVLLARYSGQNAVDVRLRYGEFGKPELADQLLHFNVSHSENLGLIAISLHPVGIDLELMSPLGVENGLIDVVCHPVEKPLFERLSASERCRLFYKLFTRKEAYCKALGVGLQRPLCSLRFADSPCSIGSQVHDEDIDKVSSFFVYDICSVIGYAVSVCLPFSDARISLLKLDPC
jgi:4'-phosphopantetheinyl transferase